MKPFTRHTGVVAPLDRDDVDTDQIVPKQFLKRVERSGYGRYLFHDWRWTDDGEPRPDFVLARPEYEGASILVAGRNFGCGSSREHAAWALQDFGFRAVIAPSFADIFRGNADQNGILTIELAAEHVRDLLERATERAPWSLTVDLEARMLFDAQGLELPYEVDPFRRTTLLEGLDRIGLTLRHEERIAAYEARREAAPDP